MMMIYCKPSTHCHLVKVAECPHLFNMLLVLDVSGIRAYEQLGLRAFGHSGKILAAVIITLHNIGGKILNRCAK